KDKLGSGHGTNRGREESRTAHLSHGGMKSMQVRSCTAVAPARGMARVARETARRDIGGPSPGFGNLARAWSAQPAPCDKPASADVVSGAFAGRLVLRQPESRYTNSLPACVNAALALKSPGFRGGLPTCSIQNPRRACAPPRLRLGSYRR